MWFTVLQVPTCLLLVVACGSTVSAFPEEKKVNFCILFAKLLSRYSLPTSHGTQRNGRHEGDLERVLDGGNIVERVISYQDDMP